jgi:tRNA(fMet)-specific endonuclease VapC
VNYLIDSDWVIEWLKGRQPAIALIDSLRNQDLAISLVTYAEVYEGIFFGRDPVAAEQGFREFQRDVSVLPLSEPVMLRVARLRGELRREGRLIADADLLIAATALDDDRTLITRNTRHFQRVRGLRLY